MKLSLVKGWEIFGNYRSSIHAWMDRTCQRPKTLLITEMLLMQMFLRYISCFLTSNNKTQNIASSAFETQIPCTRSSAGGKWCPPVIWVVLYQMSFSLSSQFSGLSTQAGSPMLLQEFSENGKTNPRGIMTSVYFCRQGKWDLEQQRRFSREHRATKSLLEGSGSPDFHTNSLLTLFL